MQTPYIHLVPKDIDDNLSFRAEVIKYGSESRENAADLWQMCADDPLFFINTFCFLQEPRDETALPFVTYDFQDSLLITLDTAVGKTDVHIEKSRTMGASWIGCALAVHRFIFRPNQMIGMASQNEDLVDSADPKSLFWKIKFILKNLPGWLLPAYKYTKLSFQNEDNDSTINGSATKDDLFRGGRYTFIWLDEFASFNAKEKGMDVAVMGSTRDVSRSRFFCSTHKGTGTEFYRIKLDVSEGRREAILCRLHWLDHPVYNVGKYRLPNGKWTSPWREREVKRSANPVEIAQEIDIDVLGSSYQFFEYPEPLLDELERMQARRPIWRGDIQYDDKGKFLGLVENESGSLSLWRNPEPKTGKFEGHFSVTCDISGGTGATNSVAEITDRETGDQVGEWANRRTEPPEFAVISVALCNCFQGAFLMWEANGTVGGQFYNRLEKLGYSNIYINRQDEKLERKVTDKPGWWSSDKRKKQALMDLKSALRSGAYTIRSAQAYRELREFVYTDNGTIEHALESSGQDPSGAGDSHADRGIALAIGYLSLRERPVYKEPVINGAKQGTYGYRLEQEALAATREKAESDCFQFN